MVLADGREDLSRLLDGLQMFGRDAAAQSGRGDCPRDALDLWTGGLLGLGLQLLHARRVLGAHHRHRLHLQHGQVLVGAALLAIDVFQPLGRLAMTSVTANRMRQICLSSRRVTQMVQADLGRQVEELSRFGLVVDGLGTRLVQRD